MESRFNDLEKLGHKENVIFAKMISELIDKINSNCAHGQDALTSEHLKYGKSEALCIALSNLFTCLMSWMIVPSSFHTGVIVPLPKKPPLNPNDVSSYRPITLSGRLYPKLLHLLLLPAVISFDECHETHLP